MISIYLNSNNIQTFFTLYSTFYHSGYKKINVQNAKFYSWNKKSPKRFLYPFIESKVVSF